MFKVNGQRLKPYAVEPTADKEETPLLDPPLIQKGYLSGSDFCTNLEFTPIFVGVFIVSFFLVLFVIFLNFPNFSFSFLVIVLTFIFMFL